MGTLILGSGTEKPDVGTKSPLAPTTLGVESKRLPSSCLSVKLPEFKVGVNNVASVAAKAILEFPMKRKSAKMVANRLCIDVAGIHYQSANCTISNTKSPSFS